MDDSPLEPADCGGSTKAAFPDPMPAQSDETRFRFLHDLARATSLAADADEVLSVTTMLTAQHLGLSNCAYADMDDDQNGFTIRGNWHEPGSPSIVGHYRLADFGLLAVQELSAGRPLIINDNATEIAPAEAKAFQDIGIAATICMPLVKSGRLIALMAIHNGEPHLWSEYEQKVIGKVTERSWTHIEQVRSESELRLSNARFRAAMRATRGVLWTNDTQGRMIGEQPGWAALTGQSFEEYQGFGWAKAVHPDDAQPTLNAWNDAVAGRKTFIFEHRIRLSNGQWGLFAIHAVPILGVAGEITEWVGVHTDITAERKSERALLEQTHMLELLNKTGAALAAELDLERLIQTVTDAGVELTGAQFGAFFYNVLNDDGASYMLYTLSGVERSAFSGFPMPRATCVFGPTFAGEGVFRSPDITKDDRYGRNEPYNGMPEGHLPVRSYLAVPVISRSGDVIGGLFFGHPETNVFTARSESVMDGLAAQAAVAIDNARLFHDLERARQGLEERVAERSLELEEAHEALRQSQKMEAIGQLTGGIAHDFNNLLTVIKGSADLLHRQDVPAEKQKRYIKAISDTADRAATLTAQLLAFARRQALKPEVFDAGDRIGEIAGMLRSLLGGLISLKLNDKCEACHIEADVSQFETALINLAVNARDSMSGEGELKIEVARSKDASDRVAVTVSDTGQGIEQADIERIFEPFYTTKGPGEGTGLGLSQVYGFVKQSGGEITVDSQVGAGATFTLNFPRVDSPVGERVVQGGSEVSKPAAGRILVVEDNLKIREFVEQLLDELGYAVISVSNAADALKLFENEAPSIDLVFTDVLMPGMSGVELAEILRERRPEIPVVLTSGYSDALVGYKADGFPLLQKPYPVDDLARTLAAALAGSGSTEVSLA